VATVVAWSDSEIQANVPSLAPGFYGVTLTTLAGTSNIVSFEVTPPPALSLTLPFAVGKTWYVCQGYNGEITHQGAAALDLSTDPNSAGLKACGQGPNASTDEVVLAPADGIVEAYGLNHEGGEKNILCLKLPGIGAMRIGHLRVDKDAEVPMYPLNKPFKRNDPLGQVAAPSKKANGNYAHIHIELHDSSSKCQKGEPTIAFSGQYQFVDAPPLPYDDNGTPKKSKDDRPNQLRGTLLKRLTP